MKKQQLDTVLNIDNVENKRKKPSDDCSLEKLKHPCWTNVWSVSLGWISVGRDTVHSLAEAHLFSYTLLQTPCFFCIIMQRLTICHLRSTKDGLKVQSSEIIRMHMEWMHSLGNILKRKILRRKKCEDRLKDLQPSCVVKWVTDDTANIKYSLFLIHIYNSLEQTVSI